MRVDAYELLQERGEIFFFCRPKVGKQGLAPEEVQRLFLVLRPESGERAIEDKQERDKKDSPGGGHGSQVNCQSTNNTKLHVQPICVPRIC